ncbi:MAG: ABC transporter permease [Acidobacteria bacterium]|jgi:ABC-type antimicrobial peptide transport system permease subunit|nr:ABC transporter permease [Acidobacteriota bacterium]
MKFFGTAFIENFKMAIATLRSNKLRSFLTIFGVIIGVITVMLISSLISGINVAVEKEVESFGTRSIFLYKMDIGIRTSAPTREERMRKNLTMEDAEAIRNLSTIELAVPFLDISNNFFGQKILVTGKNGKTSSAVQLNGTLPDIEKSTTEVLVEGRWFTQPESDNKADVCLVGSSVVENYFPYGSPVGETLEIGGREFRVIGTLQKKEQLFGGGGGNNDQSNTIYMPMGSALRLKPYANDLFILAVAREGFLNEAKDQVQDLLRIRRNVKFGEPNNFAMETAASLIEQFQSITAGVALAMVVISSIGLMIGGIGVMNIMLVSVTERTREIGIRKAIGAKQSDILLQFLIEAATLTGFGGLVGLAIGWGLTFLIALVFPSYVPLWAPLVGFFASVGIGLIFGLFPAWKAARLDPIESLRYE